MTHLYRVTFDTKKHGYRSWIRHCFAESAKEAREIIKECWEKDHDAHQFGLVAKREKPDITTVWLNSFHRRGYLDEARNRWVFDDELDMIR